MASNQIDIPVKPRILMGDDSRIVRFTLIKHIEGMFDFRDACNGEEAWEMLLIDRLIKVLITDLAMPPLDGYGLLQRSRQSAVEYHALARNAGRRHFRQRRSGTPDVATLLRWIKKGRRDLAGPHLGKLPAELQSLAELVMKRSHS